LRVTSSPAMMTSIWDRRSGPTTELTTFSNPALVAAEQIPTAMDGSAMASSDG
jgi:hypothetical protein